jgi:hypothetical protein
MRLADLLATLGRLNMGCMEVAGLPKEARSIAGVKAEELHLALVTCRYHHLSSVGALTCCPDLLGTQSGGIGAVPCGEKLGGPIHIQKVGRCQVSVRKRSAIP